MRPSAEEMESFVPGTRAIATIKATKSAIALFREYVAATSQSPVEVTDMAEDDLVDLIKGFLQTITKEDGEPYEPGSLHCLWYGLKRYFRENDIKISEDNYHQIGKHLGARCKLLKREGKGNLPNKADNATIAELKTIFDRKVAGAHSPYAMINALVLFCLLLGRRARKELRSTCLGDLIVQVLVISF